MRISDWSSDVCSSDLFAGIASQHQAGRVLHAAQALLRNGGVAGSSHFDSPHQWDGDNGWAPAQVMAVRGLQRYGFDAAACDIARRWVDAIAAVFATPGGLFERLHGTTLASPPRQAPE